jgi:cell division protein ZapA
MSTSNNQFTIQFLGKNFTVRCPEGKRAELQEAVTHLTNHVHDIRLASKVTDLEQLLVIAALNVTNELLTVKREAQSESTDIAERIKNLQKTVEEALML